MDRLENELICVTVNHRTASLEIRERLVLDEQAQRTCIQGIMEADGIAEAAIVSTCNRTEIYALLESGFDFSSGVELCIDVLRRHRKFEPVKSPPNHHVLRNESAVLHLLKVTAGLESQILGETEILGQVRRAGELSRECGGLGRMLGKLWEQAVRGGKRVRNETGIGEGALSASYAALQVARKVFGSLKGRRMLVIGTGEIGELTLQNLQGLETNTVIINRTREVAEERQARYGGDVASWDDLEREITLADVVISSTAAPEPIISYDQMRRIRSRRRGRPLLVVDLAIPRDFEESCGTLDQIFLENLDALQAVIEQTLDLRRKEIPRAENILEIEKDLFVDWAHSQEIEPTILDLRERFESIRKEELDRLRSRVDEETFAMLDEMTRKLVNRLLHRPSENLRRHDGARDKTVRAVLHSVLTEEIPHRKQSGAASAGRSTKGGDLT